MKEDKPTKTENASDVEIETPQGRNLAALGDTPRASWNVSTSTLRANLKHMRQEAKQIIVDCFLWCIENEITRQEFAKSVGLDDSTVYRIISGKYVDAAKQRLDLSQKHELAMRQWLQPQLASAGKAVNLGEFIVTRSAKKIFTACDLAVESKTPAFLYGPSHIGKTWALQYWAAQNNHGKAVYLRCPSIGGIGALLSEIAQRVGESPGKSRDKLVRGLRRAITSDMVLIFDEFHELQHTFRREGFFACVELIRELYDRSGCGIVLSMTNFGRDAIVADRKADLEQVFRRGVHRFQIGTKSGMPLQADLTDILAAHGLPFPDANLKIKLRGDLSEEPRAILRQLGKEEGLKAITERLRYAGKLAKGKAITWQDFTRAHVIIQTNATAEEDWK